MKNLENMSAEELIVVINSLKGIIAETEIEQQVYNDKVAAVRENATRLAEEGAENSDALALKVLEFLFDFDTKKIINHEYDEETIDSLCDVLEKLVAENEVEHMVLEEVIKALYSEATKIVTEKEIREYYSKFEEAFGTEQELMQLTSDEVMVILKKRIVAPANYTVDEAVKLYNNMCGYVYEKLKAQEDLDEFTGSFN